MFTVGHSVTIIFVLGKILDIYLNTRFYNESLNALILLSIKSNMK
jgi:hypothetical protein